MKAFLSILILALMIACNTTGENEKVKAANPFFTGLNEPIRYDRVTDGHIRQYAEIVMHESELALNEIRHLDKITFENVFIAYDRVINDLYKANNNCFMLYWVSTDSLCRDQGLKSYQAIDSLRNNISSDSRLYTQMMRFTETDEYLALTGHRKVFADDLIRDFRHNGVGLKDEELERFRNLKSEISDLSSQYSINMNTANAVLELDEEGAEGLPEDFKSKYREEDGIYRIPVIPATRMPVMNYAEKEATRKAFVLKYQTRAAEKNIAILDELVRKRYELGSLMGYDSYAAYAISRKMAKTPENVWAFLEDLLDRTAEKALKDHELLKEERNKETGTKSKSPVSPWDWGYYRNRILIGQYNVDQEVVRNYLSMDNCLPGMISMYEELLGLEIRKVENPPVWHEDVLLYEVYEDETLKGRFYLDLYPRPNKESWFYGVELNNGMATPEGYEVPNCLLLGNFTAPTEQQPSLLSHSELRTLFHEFGHIMDKMSFEGEISMQADSREDFGEAMAQIFENWIWDYPSLSSFAKHYQTGEVLPKELFDNMLKVKNLTSGLDAQAQLRNSVYDMYLYDRYDPEAPLDTDELWNEVDKKIAVSPQVEGSHSQASWIHVNTHPTYYYGYLWAEVYSEDMFTVFQENGLTDTSTGKRYRELILSNGTQRDIVEAVEEFLGRPSNNEAYIKSLGLD